jgi:hypothetical protein
VRDIEISPGSNLTVEKKHGLILINTDQNSRSILAASRTTRRAACHSSSAVWSEATEMREMLARPTCAPSRLIKAREDFFKARLVGGFGAKRHKLKSGTAFTLSFPPMESMRIV